METSNILYINKLVEQEMRIYAYGEQPYGCVYVKGNVPKSSNIYKALVRSGGKPQECLLSDFSANGLGVANPDYLITLKSAPSTIIIVECKNTGKRHKSESQNHPKDFTVDGVLYYAKFLKLYYNVIAVAISATQRTEVKADTFYWAKDSADFSEIGKAKNIILDPENYLKLIYDGTVQKVYSLSEVKSTAVRIHESLRINKVSEKLKPLFIAGLLVALQDNHFCNIYDNITDFDDLLNNTLSAIELVLLDNEISSDKVYEIKQKFAEIGSVIKLKSTPLSAENSLRWYICQLELRIKPMINHANNTIDAIGVFYHEFISYSLGDGNALGIVLTPQHLTEFMAELINIESGSSVIDICCGSGSLLVTALSKMLKGGIKPQDIIIVGIEQDTDIHTLALVNMVMHTGINAQIVHGDCFDNKTINLLNDKINMQGDSVVFDKGLLNPPYSQKDHSELEFLERELELICTGGEVAVVCPMSCAIGTKYKAVRKRLMQKHTLKAVFTMPDDIMYGQGVGACVCVMVWVAKHKHDSNVPTFFGYYKDDGFVKRKKLGRIDANNKWDEVKSEWLKMYRENEIVDGLTTQACVTCNDEWLCEAYMKTDYTKLTQGDFQKTVNDYFAHLIKG